MDHCEITEKTVSHAHNFHGCHKNLQYIEMLLGTSEELKMEKYLPKKDFIKITKI